MLGDFSGKDPGPGDISPGLDSIIINNYNFSVSSQTFTSPVQTPTRIPTLAASAATQQELEEAKARREKEGSKPVQTDRRIWRPQVTSQYKEPDCIPDPMGELEVLYGDHGKPLWANKQELPPRDDLISFDDQRHQEELQKNLQWKDCPEKYRTEIKSIILDFWDVFAEEGVRNPIRGAYFHVDTGEVAPVCVKPPRYGPHETRVINDLIEKLEKNGIIEDDDGPWGAPIVLAAKANQEHLHWSQYVWRLCVSYRKLNAVVRPFTFPVTRCDDAVREIGDSKYFITLDLDSGYWQVPCEPSSKTKLAFFTPNGKKRFRTMPMGATNAHPVFVALVAKFKKEWDKLAENSGLTGHKSQVIVDDIMLSARDVPVLLKYLRCVLQILQHYRCTAKLKKCRFLPSVAEFVGLDIHQEGNSPAKSKFEAFQKLERPKTFTDLNMVIGCFGFYQEHLPLFEVRIRRWRNIQKLRPAPGTAKREEQRIMEEAWKPDDDRLLEDLKEAILKEPILRRPDSNMRFYLKTDWSKNAMGAALLQPAPTHEALEAMAREQAGEQCVFDLTKSGLRLHPIAFISRRTSEPEKSYHSYVGEACAGIWAIEKFRPFLFGREFTWLTDCSGLRKFFEGDDIPTHMIQRWRMQLLRYDFTIVHRPGRMMFECDLLSRYNQETAKWREPDQVRCNVTPVTRRKQAAMPWTNIPVRFTPGKVRISSMFQKSGQHVEVDEHEREMAILESCDNSKSVWIVGARMNAIGGAMNDLGIDVIHETAIETDPVWRNRMEGISWEEAREAADSTECSPDWLIITGARFEETRLEQIRELIEALSWKGLRAAIIFHENQTCPNPKLTHASWNRWTRDMLNEQGWSIATIWCENSRIGGAIDVEYKAFILAEFKLVENLRLNGTRLPAPGQNPEEEGRSLQEALNKPVNFQVVHPTQERHIDSGTPHPWHVAKCGSKVEVENGKSFRVFSTDFPCPNLAMEECMGPRGTPLISQLSPEGERVVRHLSIEEVGKVLGLSAQLLEKQEDENWDEDEVVQEMKYQPPRETIRAVLAIIIEAEERGAGQTGKLEESSYANEQVRTLAELTSPINRTTTCLTKIDRWTVLPLPTHQKWAEATQKERDLSRLLEALKTGAHISRHQISHKQYHDAWEKGQLEQEDGIIYHIGEPRWTQIRQLRRRVVPKSLRQLVITAYHATPLAGHSGQYRTYWRVAARYWWPRMYMDVREAVGACAHCKLANATGHESGSILQALSTDGPFDVVAMDVWSPGSVPDKEGNIKALTSLDTTTGFASAAIMDSMNSEAVARSCFASFFVPNGLPKLILVDSGSENKGVLISMCQLLGIKYHMVAPEQHNGILCERFHRYLNKVQKICAVNNQSYTQWVLGVMFATYSWNAAPIDGTNLIRSFVAKGRVFPFPIQILEEENPARIPQGQGEDAIAFMETNFPLWAKQSTMLQILVAERRERHRELANAGKTQRVFQIGDLVIIRKQVQSDSDKGIPAKQKFRWKGMYRVVEKAGDGTYWVQKLPTIQGTGVPGRKQKYAATVMERVPSSLIVNKQLDTSDTRLAALEGDLVSNPLEQNLGLFEYGRYVRANPEAGCAFDKVEDLWQINLEDSDDESDDVIREPVCKRRKQATQQSNSTPECLYRKLAASKSKAIIIQADPSGNSGSNKWYVATVDWDESNQEDARTLGVYRVRWCVPHHKDSEKRRRRDCRYWPEVHEVQSKGTLGRMRPIAPHKATRQLLKKHNWAFYEWDVNLCQDLLTGPFEFEIINNEPFRIPGQVWKDLREQAVLAGVDTSDLNKVIPLS